MRVHHPRFTLRWLMLVVAIAALLLTTEKFRRAWRHRSALAAEFTAEAKSWSEDCTKLEAMAKMRRSQGDTASLKRVADLEEVLKNNRRLEREYQEKAARYTRAARYPWMPIDPDPPEPK